MPDLNNTLEMHLQIINMYRCEARQPPTAPLFDFTAQVVSAATVRPQRL